MKNVKRPVKSVQRSDQTEQVIFRSAEGPSVSSEEEEEEEDEDR